MTRAEWEAQCSKARREQRHGHQAWMTQFLHQVPATVSPYNTLTPNLRSVLKRVRYQYPANHRDEFRRRLRGQYTYSQSR